MIKEIWNALTSSGKRSLIISVIGFFFYSLSGILIIFLVLNALESIMKGEINLKKYWVYLIICLFIKGGSNILADIQKHFAGFDIVYEIREKIVYRLKTFSLGFYTNERLGEISTIIHKDVDNMEMIVGHIWTRMSADFIVSIVLFSSLIYLDLKMGIFMLSTIPFALFLLFFGLKKSEILEEKNGNNLVDMVSLFVEYVKGIPLLKAFSQSKKFNQQLEDTILNFGISSKLLSKNKASILSIYCFLIDLAFWIMTTAGIFLVLNKKLSVIYYLIFIVISREFYKPFFAMEEHWMNYLKVIDSFRRIKHIIEAPIVVETSYPQKPSEFDIKFKNVSFYYEEASFSLNNISFNIPEHTVTALVGESGSGKTTITNLLLRFWDIKKGSINIGNIDIRDMSYDELLEIISIVMQNVQLFSDTIEDNIRIGKEKATMEEIIQAAKKARIHDFIMSLPSNYQTKIGENGVGLSGGQKQRISIARAFLKDAPILLLDEFTSNVDPINEVLIQEALSELVRNKTVLVVAHHLNTIRSADQILVFKNGNLIQIGNHELLIKEKTGYYYNLWSQGAKKCTR